MRNFLYLRCDGVDGGLLALTFSIFLVTGMEAAWATSLNKAIVRLINYILYDK